MSPQTTKAWTDLKAHADAMRDTHMRTLFEQDPTRFETFQVQACKILLDYSKNRITADTMDKLFALARERDVEGWRERMFVGAQINATEHRAVLHTALRAPLDREVYVEGENVMPHVARVLERMRGLSDSVREGTHRGATGKLITTIVNIGIGGSHLGPQLAVEALAPYLSPLLNVRFLSGVDRTQLDNMLSEIAWDETLFIIGSKSWTTQETMMNAETVRAWFLQNGGDENTIAQHFVAVTAQPDKAQAFGIHPDNIFEMWDWVGGRYSVWSAVGLPLALAIGPDGFDAFLAGAREMDQHFLTTPMERNMPMIMALLGVWYANFHGVHAHAVVPYTQLLTKIVDYLQQLDMESNGKSTTWDGEAVTHATAPVIWGGPGTSSQHSFFQRLHQGVGFVPVDFIAVSEPNVAIDPRNATLLANCFAQSKALMQGKTEAEVRAEMKAQGATAQDIEELAPHKIFTGDRPSNTLLLRWLDPKTLGALIALYEHKVFVQGIIWNVDSFDQWGVELGKTLALDISRALKGQSAHSASPTANAAGGDSAFDSSTQGLIDAARGVPKAQA